MSAIPEWLKQSNVGACRCCAVSCNGKKSFVDKGLQEISSFLTFTIFQEEYARRSGFLQNLNAKAKLVLMLSLIVFTSFATSLKILLVLYFAALILALSSKIELKVFIARVWIFIPVFAGIIALPSIFSIVTPGKALAGISFIGREITITYEGVEGAFIFVLRVAVSVSFAVLLMMTTKWNELTKAIAVLRVPSVFIITLEMTYRYIFLLIKTAHEMHLAKKSRTIKKESMREAQEWAASRIAALFRKSYYMAEEVHLAMLSRGYRAK